MFVLVSLGLDEQTTVSRVLDERLARAPDAPAFDFAGTTATVAELSSQADRLAAALASRGIVAGDRIATMLDNGPEQIVCFYATMRLGAVFVPVNTAFFGDFLHHVLVDAGARVELSAPTTSSGSGNARHDSPT